MFQHVAEVSCWCADSMLTVAVYEMTGILPTDPGYGYYRDHVQMFDPGWKGYQTKGPEDWNFDVFDKGNDPEGVLERCAAHLCCCHALCSCCYVQDQVRCTCRHKS